jgi:hypothetical protein
MSDLAREYGNEEMSWQKNGYNPKDVLDDRVAFFIDQLMLSTHTCSYVTYVTHAGTFSATPASVHDVPPGIWERSASDERVRPAGLAFDACHRRVCTSWDKFHCVLSTLKTGWFGAISSNAATGASLLISKCGRAPGAICRYAFKIGARRLTSTSTKRTDSLIPCRSTAFPSAARTFFTQLVFAPNIDTRYLSPFMIVIASGRLTILPDFLPTTSSVTIRLGNTPSE